MSSLNSKTACDVQIAEVSTGNKKVLSDVMPKLDKLWIFYPHLLKLNLLMFGSLFTQITNGYDGGMMNNLQTLESWSTYFNNPSGSRLGTMNNGVVIGTLVITPFISILAEHIGRRWTILIGALIAIIGAILQGAAQDFGMFLGSRILVGAGTGLTTAVAEVYLTECAYPSQRPIFVGLLQAGYPMGSLLGALVTWGPYNNASLKTSTWSWRIPSIIQGFFPLLVLAIFFFGPESPRYLISKGKHEKAREFFVKYHGGGDENSELVNFQMAEITSTLEAEKEQKMSRWTEWFSSKAMIHRLAIVTFLAPMIQLCGNAIISYYLNIMLNGIGITDSLTKLKINIGISAWGLIWDIGACLVLNRFSRKAMFISGFLLMAVCLVIYTILASFLSVNQPVNDGFVAGAVLMIFLFQGFYHLVGPTAIVYYTELTPFSLRAKAAQIYLTTGMAISFFNGYVNPIGLEAIGWKYYIPWDIWLLIMAIIVYFGFPETRGKSLEEMAEIFGDAVVDQEEITRKFEKNEIIHDEASTC